MLTILRKAKQKEYSVLALVPSGSGFMYANNIYVVTEHLEKDVSVYNFNKNRCEYMNINLQVQHLILELRWRAK